MPTETINELSKSLNEATRLLVRVLASIENGKIDQQLFEAIEKWLEK